jgi:hypothetical protein
VQIRWHVFNLTDTPALDDLITNFESPDFGKVVHAVPARRGANSR